MLTFWFDPAHHDEWYAARPQFDALIRERFATTVDAAVAGKLSDWTNTPSGWLALLIVLDQFTRNLYRNDARAWKQDLRAQQLAVWGIEEAYDGQLPAIQRVFAYMPLEHAEDRGMQDRCVALFESLCDGLPPEERSGYIGFLDYARKHRAVIARFGRFPHRNAVLGRANTPDEVAYLAESGAGF
ncbi:DUF924 domain-containing protein [Dyella psychrodurans]|uniref:DUF924 domain-containing protein n=1 Tax=Dyella psychrodurans TaxID=1927960 RepID=A0A370X4X2_9GAMM|nr:DUF924 domain-containing protein [Dyella psychrodurans]